MQMPPISDLLLALFMSAAAGLVGSIAVMRRMALASDALSHIALPGIALALMLHVSPLLGGFVALIVGTLLVWALEYRTRIPTEAVIGVLFSAALAIGSLMTSGEDLLEALLGAPGVSGAPSSASSRSSPDVIRLPMANAAENSTPITASVGMRVRYSSAHTRSVPTMSATNPP